MFNISITKTFLKLYIQVSQSHSLRKEIHKTPHTIKLLISEVSTSLYGEIWVEDVSLGQSSHISKTLYGIHNIWI